LAWRPNPRLPAKSATSSADETRPMQTTRVSWTDDRDCAFPCRSIFIRQATLTRCAVLDGRPLLNSSCISRFAMPKPQLILVYSKYVSDLPRFQRLLSTALPTSTDHDYTAHLRTANSGKDCPHFLKNYAAFETGQMHVVDISRQY